MKYLYLVLVVLQIGLAACGSASGGGASPLGADDSPQRGSDEQIETPSDPGSSNSPAPVNVQDVAMVGDISLSNEFNLVTDHVHVAVTRGDELVFNDRVSLVAGAFDWTGLFDEPGTYSIAMKVKQTVGTATNSFFWVTSNMTVVTDDDIQLGSIQFDWTTHILTQATFPDVDDYSYEVELTGMGAAVNYVVDYHEISPVNSNVFYAIPFIPPGFYEHILVRYTQASNGQVYDQVLENILLTRDNGGIQDIDFR